MKYWLALIAALCVLAPAAGFCDDYRPRKTQCLKDCADKHIDQINDFTECAADCPEDKSVTRFAILGPRELDPAPCWATCQDQFYGCFQDCPGGIDFPYKYCVKMCGDRYSICVQMCVD